MLATPLLREGTPLGVILIARGPEVIRSRPSRSRSSRPSPTRRSSPSRTCACSRSSRREREADGVAGAADGHRRDPAGDQRVRRPTSQPVLDAVVAERRAILCAEATTSCLRTREGRSSFVAHMGPPSSDRRHGPPTSVVDHRDAAGPSSIGATVTWSRHARQTSREFPSIGGAPAAERDSRTTPGHAAAAERHAIGAIVIAADEVRPFTDKQIALLETFADQAVIAIENVRLFTELEEKNRALTQAHAQVTESLEQQTATSEILRVISGSPTDVQPVFDAIRERRAALRRRLCGLSSGSTANGSSRLPRTTLRPARRVAQEVFDGAPMPRHRRGSERCWTRRVVHIVGRSREPDSRARRRLARAPELSQHPGRPHAAGGTSDRRRSWSATRRSAVLRRSRSRSSRPSPTRR